MHLVVLQLFAFNGIFWPGGGAARPDLLHQNPIGVSDNPLEIERMARFLANSGPFRRHLSHHLNHDRSALSTLQTSIGRFANIEVAPLMLSRGGRQGGWSELVTGAGVERRLYACPG